MEPQTPPPFNNQQPIVQLPPQGPQRSSWGPSKKVIGLGIIIFAAIIGLGLFFLTSSNTDTSDGPKGNAGKATSPYHDRDGYARSELSANVGDPLAVVLKKDTTNIQSVGGVVVLPACAVLTQANLRSTGLHPQPSPAATVSEMNYMDGLGSGPIPFAEHQMPAGEDSNTCTYALTAGGSVKVEVLQPYLAAEEAIVDDLNRNYSAAAPIAGISEMQLYRQKANTPAARPDTTQYYVRKGTNISLKLTLTSTDADDRQAKTESLLKAAATNMERLANSPEGAPTITYNSPTFTQKFLRACSLLTNNDLQVLTGGPAAAFVTERFANATGVAEFQNLGDKTRYNYIESGCRRSGASSSSVNRTPRMDIVATSYNSAKAAGHHLKIENQKSKGALAVSGIGDEAVVVTNPTGDNCLVLRKGRVVVTLTYNAQAQQKTGLDDQSKIAAALTPYAKQILPRLPQ